MSLSGDRPDKYPRSKGFTPMGQYLQHVKADVIFAMFGYNESFSGPQAADSHKKLLIDFVAKLRSYKPNGEEFPRIVLFSPIAFEDLKDRNLPQGKALAKTSPLSPRPPRMPPERRAWHTSTCSSRA